MIDREEMKAEKQLEEDRLLHGEVYGEYLHYKSLFNLVINACGRFVCFPYEGNAYIGITASSNEENIYISVTVKSLKSWK
jgi:hypothetical protein